MLLVSFVMRYDSSDGVQLRRHWTRNRVEQVTNARTESIAGVYTILESVEKRGLGAELRYAAVDCVMVVDISYIHEHRGHHRYYQSYTRSHFVLTDSCWYIPSSYSLPILCLSCTLLFVLHRRPSTGDEKAPDTRVCRKVSCLDRRVNLTQDPLCRSAGQRLRKPREASE